MYSVFSVQQTGDYQVFKVEINNDNSRDIETSVEPTGNTMKLIGNTMESIGNTMKPIGNTMEPIRNTMKPIGNTMEPIMNTMEPIMNTMEPIGNTLEDMRTSKDQRLKYTDESGMFKCPQCGKGYGCKRHLTRHMKRHSGAKPHKCEFCSMGK